VTDPSANVPAHAQCRHSNPTSRWRRLTLAAWLIYWAGLTYLLLAPKVPRAPITISAKGLVVHFCTFAVLAYAGACVRRAGGRPCTIPWACAWLAIYAAYAGATELLQPLSGRHTDLDDFLADSAGAAVMLAVSVLRWRRHPM